MIDVTDEMVQSAKEELRMADGLGIKSIHFPRGEAAKLCRIADASDVSRYELLRAVVCVGTGGKLDKT